MPGWPTNHHDSDMRGMKARIRRRVLSHVDTSGMEMWRRRGAMQEQLPKTMGVPCNFGCTASILSRMKTEGLVKIEKVKNGQATVTVLKAF